MGWGESLRADGVAGPRPPWNEPGTPRAGVAARAVGDRPARGSSAPLVRVMRSPRGSYCFDH